MRLCRPALLSCLLTASLCAQDAWVQKTQAGPPTSGMWPGMAYALSTGKTYVFGGGWGVPDETWSWDGNAWTKLFPSPTPGRQRHTFGMCYDVIRDRIVLFGGTAGSGGFNDTWEFDPQAVTWTDVTPAAPALSPPWRWGHRMTYDLTRGKCVLFGGYDWGGFYNDTWEWDGTTWTNVGTANAPSPRDRFAFAFDSNRARCVLFGGITDVNGTTSNETWEYDGLDWTLVNTPTSPEERQKVVMAYDMGRGTCVMQGGQNANGQLTDCWEYDGSNWYLIGSAPGPARGEGGTAYDINRGVTIIFGGWNGQEFEDTWEFGAVTTPHYSTFGSGCAGSNGVPGMLASTGGEPALGGAFSVDLSNLQTGGGVGYMMIGFGNHQFASLYLPLDLGTLGFMGCTSYVEFVSGIPFQHSGPSHTFSLPIPNDPALAGAAFYNQALCIDLGSANGALATTAAGYAVIR